MSKETKLHTITLGENQDMEIIWLHGWGQDHNCFVPLAQLYENKATNILVDLYGFGKSPLLFSGANTSDYAKAINDELLSKPTNKKRIIVGHSFGCRVAIQLASQYPEAAQAFVLISAAGLKRKRSVGWKIKAGFLKNLGKLAGLADKFLNTKFKEKYSQKFGSSDYKNAGELRDTFVRTVNEDLTIEASMANQPTLLIFGEDDQDTPPEFGERYEKIMPNAQLKLLKGYGHLDILNRGAHQCQTIINKFLDKLG